MREKNPQLDIFFEADPGLKEKFNKANFRVSILGGKGGADIARELGKNLTKDFYTIQTGGYDFEVMKAGLEEANEAIDEMSKKPETKKILDQVYPYPKGIVIQDIFADKVIQGNHIQTQKEEGELAAYKRLGKLNEHASAVIILPGGIGTEIELMTNLHFNKEINQRVNLPSKPLIFIGNSHLEMVQKKFGEVVNKSQDVYLVSTPAEAKHLVDLLEQIQNSEEKDKSGRACTETDKYLLKFKG